MKGFLVGALLISMIGTVSYVEHNYTRKDCVAIEASETGVIFKDKCGFTWYWEESGFEVGDVVDLKMNDNCSTSYIDDDIITKVVRK